MWRTNWWKFNWRILQGKGTKKRCNSSNWPWRSASRGCDWRQGLHWGSLCSDTSSRLACLVMRSRPASTPPCRCVLWECGVPTRWLGRDPTVHRPDSTWTPAMHGQAYSIRHSLLTTNWQRNKIKCLYIKKHKYYTDAIWNILLGDYVWQFCVWKSFSDN